MRRVENEVSMIFAVHTQGRKKLCTVRKQIQRYEKTNSNKIQGYETICTRVIFFNKGMKTIPSNGTDAKNEMTHTSGKQLLNSRNVIGNKMCIVIPPTAPSHTALTYDPPGEILNH
jgi:hypothetical protein